ncbi:MAG: heavy metal sensor histidine kinase, partial [Proteobacteria bacterium]|nr:heavy metal sensor histidine kinase [Pseudomonadota bacterium]
SSQNISQPIVVPKEFFVAALQGKQRFDTTTVTFSPDKELLLRVLTMPVVENKTVAYIIQVARSLDTVQSALDNFKAILFVLLPLVVFITGIISAFLAKITLNPVDRIIKTVQKTTAENLKLRIPVPTTKDEVQRLAATFNDMLERLEKAFSSQRHFIQDASHELKTPLTILQGELEVTLKKIRSVDEYESVLNSSLEEIKRISKIVEDLLLLARFEDRETALDRREFDINRLLQSAIDELAVLAQHKKITVAFSADHTITINGDEQRLKQVFLNILDNAIKYTPSGGTISLSVSVTSRRVEISIADTGIGIPHTDLPHIFDRFYRIDKSRNSSGFGLGLSIAKTIIEAHQGSISADSVINHGTTFTISLPVTAPSH